MSSMTGIERMSNILRRKKVDRIALFEHYWKDTLKEWEDNKFITADESLEDHFGYDMQHCKTFVFKNEAKIDFSEVVEEKEETVLIRNGNGALLRQHKLHNSTPEHVDFLVKDREGWEEHIKPLIVPDSKRIDFELYRKTKRHAAEKNRFFVWNGDNVFELMSKVCGHENLLVGMALDPDWIKDMVETYTNFILGMQEILFEKEGYPDGIWFYEDMGFKQKPFFSPTMYRELLQPAHIKTFGYAHSRKLPVIMHSCGYIEPLLPYVIESGIDCLQAIETKAGMDLVKLHKDYGDVLSFMGGIDVRVLCSNDRKIIDDELEAKIPAVMSNFGYTLHSDHSIPNTVHYDTYRYFITKGLDLGTYK